MGKKIELTVENCRECPYCLTEKFNRWIIMCKHMPTLAMKDYPQIPDWCPLEDVKDE